MNENGILETDTELNTNPEPLIKKDIDYRIVGFKLGNEFYGVDISLVKEIVKQKTLTRIPNSLPYVMGVINLRGEIVPIINLRKMFNLKIKDVDKEASIIIIRNDNILIGMCVDQINGVISLDRGAIQPPSLLLGNINIHFIEGVVEYQKSLFVLLNIKKIFFAKNDIMVLPDSFKDNIDKADENFEYFGRQLQENFQFHLSDINIDQISKIFSKIKNHIDIAQINTTQLNESVQQFLSKNTNEFWQADYINDLRSSVLTDFEKSDKKQVEILNWGCGNGFESFSLLFFLISNLPSDYMISIYAVDKDLMSITNANGLEIKDNYIPDWVDQEKFFEKIDNNLLKVRQKYNDLINFDFTDFLQPGVKKQYKLILLRDVLSFLKQDELKICLSQIVDKLEPGGYLIIGDKENIDMLPEFEKLETQYMSIYRKK